MADARGPRHRPERGQPCLVPADERERVFDRFYRRSGQSPSGSGLGLAIVRTIARRHKAEVRLNDTPGGGLTARIVFPGSARPA